MTPLVVIVGFLGSGKTTFLKNVLPELLRQGLQPTVLLNDYQNAQVDAEQLRPLVGEIRAITGDCVCCGSRDELVEELGKFEPGAGKLVILETNGTTDSEQLIEMLSLENSLRKFSAPIQVSIVDAQRWQKRYWHNGLEREQVRTASHLVISRVEKVSPKRLEEVEESLVEIGVRATGITPESFAADLREITRVLAMVGSRAETTGGQGHQHDDKGHHDHAHAHHFASLELALPARVERAAFARFLADLPDEVIRAKGMVCFTDRPEEYVIFQKVDRFDEAQYFPIERAPAGTAPLALFIGPQLPEGMLRTAVARLAQG